MDNPSTDTKARIWVDADACPRPIKEILFRAAERRAIRVVLVANQFVTTPKSKYILTLQVAPGFDVADNEIVRQTAPDDLVVTSDIPLAAAVIEKGASAISPRGEVFTAENIRARLNIRDFMDTMRSSGIHTGGPPPLSQSDRKAFADAFDRWLSRAR